MLLQFPFGEGPHETPVVLDCSGRDDGIHHGLIRHAVVYKQYVILLYVGPFICNIVAQAGHSHRCGDYSAIIDAVLDAAERYKKEGGINV